MPVRWLWPLLHCTSGCCASELLASTALGTTQGLVLMTVP